MVSLHPHCRTPSQRSPSKYPGRPQGASALCAGSVNPKTYISLSVPIGLRTALDLALVMARNIHSRPSNAPLLFIDLPTITLRQLLGLFLHQGQLT